MNYPLSLQRIPLGVAVVYRPAGGGVSARPLVWWRWRSSDYLAAGAERGAGRTGALFALGAGACWSDLTGRVPVKSMVQPR